MGRLILLVIALRCSSAFAGGTEDYLLRVDTVGYVDQVASEEVEESVLRTVEVVVRPESAFHCKQTDGTETVLLEGKLHPSDKGLFVCDIRYVRSVATGDRLPTEDGGWEPRFATRSARTTISVALDDSATLGSFATKTRSPGKLEVKSVIRHVLTLTKYESPGGQLVEEASEGDRATAARGDSEGPVKNNLGGLSPFAPRTGAPSRNERRLCSSRDEETCRLVPDVRKPLLRPARGNRDRGRRRVATKMYGPASC